jgi:hypothetical protein
MMRHSRTVLIALFVASLLLVGCRSTNIPEQTRTVAFDFTGYDDFLITPERYRGSYQSIGMIEMRVTPKAEDVTVPANEGSQILDGDTYRVGNYRIERIEPDTLVARAVRRARDMGANAITHWSVDQKAVQRKQVALPVFVVSGFAIRRTDLSSAR